MAEITKNGICTQITAVKYRLKISKPLSI